MKTWTKILPFFIVAFIAKRKLERFTVAGETVVVPYKGVYIKIEKSS